MREIPPMPTNRPEKTLQELTLEELDGRLERVNQDIKDLLKRRGKTKNSLIQKSLDLQFANKINEKAGYLIRRQELLQKGGEEA